MSRENVEVVKALFAAWNADDMDAYRELLDPATFALPPRDWPEPGPFEGREAVMNQFAGMRNALDFDTAEPVSDFVHGADRVVVRMRWQGAGHGPDVKLEMTGIYTVRSGTIRSQEFFWDHAEALEAVGLSA
jgi:ketosteroid isomerase-like protein